MRKSCLIVAGVVVLIVLGCLVGLGGWFAWTRLVRPALTPEAERGHSTMRQTGQLPEAPAVEIRVDSVSPGKAIAGWPLLVRLSVRCPLSSDAQAPKPMILSGRNGSWHDSLQLTVEDPARKSVEWRWRQPSSERGPMTLDGRVGLEWIWWLPGAETERIPAGKYSVKAVVDSSAVKAAEAWKGVVSSQPVSLVFEPPRQHSPEEGARKEILKRFRWPPLCSPTPASLKRRTNSTAAP